MQIKRLSLTQFRVFERAEFDFEPGMNIIVGVNGVGKSSVLDALRIMLSQALPKFTASKSQPQSFDADDITVGGGALTAQLNFSITIRETLPLFAEIDQEIPFTYLGHQPREKYIGDKSSVGKVRGQAIDQIERYEIKPSESEIPKRLKTLDEQPIVVYFSPHRSLYTMKAPSKTKSAGGQAVAYADALSERELNLREFADWWLAQSALAKERSRAKSHLQVLETTVTRFLDGFRNLHATHELQKISTDKYETRLLLEKNGLTLDVRQLSDGERGVLALVLDLARRLSQANPKLEDPLHDGKAVVLIDELDLHLHPSWQREIVEKLGAVFPNCQFIATTHSPQIIGEVSPEKIILLEVGKQPYHPHQSLGMDSNWVLRHLMEVDERNVKTKRGLKRIANLIEKEKHDAASKSIDALRKKYGEFPELIQLQTRIDRIRLLGK